MAEPTHHWAAWLFLSLIAGMMFAAGGAALPPARDARVLIGATTVFGAWLATLILQRTFQDWNITSAFFLLDVAYCVIFYLISRPSKSDVSGEVYERNWAGDVFFIFVAIVFIEIAHFAEFYLTPRLAASVLVVLASNAAIIAFGFWRGFGIWNALTFLAFVAATFAAAHYSYGASLNFLTALVAGRIALRGASGSIQNVRALQERLSKARRGSDDLHRRRRSRRTVQIR